MGQVFFRAAIVQVAVDSLNCVLLSSSGCAAFNRGVGLLAALILAFFGQAVFHALMPAKETWAVLFLLLALLAILRAVRVSSPDISSKTRTLGRAAFAWWFAAGLALAGLTLLRGNACCRCRRWGLWVLLAVPHLKRDARVLALVL